jgi:hypothetical protein
MGQVINKGIATVQCSVVLRNLMMRDRTTLLSNMILFTQVPSRWLRHHHQVPLLPCNFDAGPNAIVSHWDGG